MRFIQSTSKCFVNVVVVVFVMAAEANEDLATLSELDEQLILDQLKRRYSKDAIYTYVGDILIAVNPFKSLPIYSKKHSNLYKNAPKGSQPPHLFAIVDKAHQALHGYGAKQPENQCCVISGESGAGKTESCKLLIKHLIDLSGGTSELDQQILLHVRTCINLLLKTSFSQLFEEMKTGVIEKQRYQTEAVNNNKKVNPLLEAFGNAKTVMNNNSSRFGKYIQLKFRDKKVDGAKISEYLLEKSRVVHQNFGEQNFHIFYFMFAGLQKEKLAELKLDTIGTFRYITNGFPSMSKHRHSLQREYETVVNAMDIVGFLEQEQEDMLKILAGILNLGNVHFVLDDDDFAVVKEGNTLQSAATLLGMDYVKLSDVLTSFVTVTRGSHIKRRYSQSQAQSSRDAMTKSLYGRLFSWIVNKINRLVAPEQFADPTQPNEIGLLDIFGFEHFEKNSFEQACINMANEQLQYFFNQHIFKWEQEEYHREGIDWSDITFADNQPVLDFFFGKPVGFLSILDEESRFPQSTDLSFTQKLGNNFGRHTKLFQKPKSDMSLSFAVYHYAGKVQYIGEGFLEKNRDAIPPGLMQILQTSDNRLVAQIFAATITRTGTLALQGRYSVKGRIGTKPKKLSVSRQKFMANKKAITVGTQFKNSLTLLMERLNSAAPHFIRCIKPNTEKVPETFDDIYVQKQLKYTGILETTRIRREGYSVRLSFKEFVERYKVISLDLGLPPTSSSCAWILHTAKMNNWKMGNTKVFLKYWHLDLLSEYIRNLDKSAIKIQKVVRGFIDRRKVRKLRIVVAKEAEKVLHFLAQVERLAQLVSKREAMLDKIPINNMPSPASFKPIDNFSFPPPPTEFSEKPEEYLEVLSNNNRLDNENIYDDVEEDSLEAEEDNFKPLPKYDAKQFGRVGTKKAAAKWFQETQIPKGAVQSADGNPDVWFHGLIPRREAERLLSAKPIGCFLIRVSESRFGYSLSFKSSNRCKHYFIEQTRSGKYVIVGFPKAFASLSDLIKYHSKNPVSDVGDILTLPCGQESDVPDYSDLYEDLRIIKNRKHKDKNYGLTPVDELPPPLPEKCKGLTPIDELPPPLPLKGKRFNR